MEILKIDLESKFVFASYHVDRKVNRIIKLTFYCFSKICIHFATLTELNYLVICLYKEREE